MFDDASLAAAYRGETEQLTAERLPLAVALALSLLGLSGIFEYLLQPANLGVFALVYGLQVVAFAPLVVARRPLLRRGWLPPANAAAWCAVAGLIVLYGAASGTPREMTALGLICLMTGGSLLLPWGVRGQAALVASAVAAVALLLGAGTALDLRAAYVLFAVLAAGAISLLGAYYFELHRFAIFCEATRREEEMAISQSLVAIAREINESLDADDVLDRIAGVVRSALHAAWSVIVLRDGAGFVVVGAAGPVPEPIAHLRGVEFGHGAFPLVDRVLAAGDLVLADDDGDAAVAGLLRRCATPALLGAALARRGEPIGVLFAGASATRGPAAERRRELFRGVAQHVAIALNNVRLLTDLRRANNLKSEFLSTMSHELRTPLNVIIGYADLLRDEAFGPVGGEQPEVIGRLRDNARSLLELINATLEVHRIEAGRTSPQLREVDLRALLAELQQETDHLPRAPGVALRWEVPRTNDLVRTDPVKLKIVVRNLVGNALKFTSRGAVTVAVQLDVRSRQLEVQVRDTGVGIPADQLPMIFDMFHQAPSDAATAGVGLGLYIVKRFVELLGGRVQATSTPGSGSQFRLSLPAGLVVAPPRSLDEHRRRRSA